MKILVLNSGSSSLKFQILMQADLSMVAIEKLIPLAPLHNPANLAGIRIMMESLANKPRMTVVSTVFH